MHVDETNPRWPPLDHDDIIVELERYFCQLTIGFTEYYWFIMKTTHDGVSQFQYGRHLVMIIILIGTEGYTYQLTINITKYIGSYWRLTEMNLYKSKMAAT